MKRKQNGSLLIKCGIIFLVFTIITLAISGITTFVNQKQIYQEQQEEKLQDIAGYLGTVLQADGDDFSIYQEYFMAHHDEMDVPVDFDDEDALEARNRYETLFSEQYPGKTLGQDITFAELSPQVQNAFAVYHHERYLLLFEKARDIFDLIYTYYIVSTEEPLVMCYVLDAVREVREPSGTTIDLGQMVEQVPERHGKMWEAWNTGTIPSGYDTYDNEYGKTYAWYVPLYVGGEKLGLISTEVEIDDYNKAIAANTMRQLASIAAVLLITGFFMLLLIDRLYIAKLRSLSELVSHYTQNMDASIIKQIERNARGRDEIARLAGQTSEMILEMDNYMNSLTETSQELSQAREEADALNRRANKDALTGIRNRNAYEDELNRLGRKLAEGNTEFGIAMVDLNYLKRINDTYGHEQGNIALRKCCQLICEVFAHSPVFRIGGDEFAIVLEKEDYRNIRSCVAEFDRRIEELSRDRTIRNRDRVSAAIGYALYDPMKDSGVEDVFKRADRAMYNRKHDMKAERR